ncbi:MAG: hypothetical protein NTW25_03795 [Candidatus Kapabacteria bacterium]|jgi:hypothetical protein|nr:hypothetical protein [Candidatus Kapabacteria bacterium]
MNILLEIPDEKAIAFDEFINSLGYVISKHKVSPQSIWLNELEEAVSEINLINSGKAKSRNAMDFINEL